MTQRLERLIISGTARAVQTSPTGVEDHVGTLSLHVLPHEPPPDDHPLLVAWRVSPLLVVIWCIVVGVAGSILF